MKDSHTSLFSELWQWTENKEEESHPIPLSFSLLSTSEAAVSQEPRYRKTYNPTLRIERR